MATPERDPVTSSVLSRVCRAAAIWSCFAPIYVGIALSLLEPSRYEAMLSLGWVLVLALAAAFNLRAAFACSSSPSLWVYSFVGSIAAAFFVVFLASLDGRAIAWLFSAVLVLPALCLSAWNITRSLTVRAAQAPAARA